jgi:hypothetical protein
MALRSIQRELRRVAMGDVIGLFLGIAIVAGFILAIFYAVSQDRKDRGK